MTNEQRSALELVFDMTTHPGWKYIVKECEEKIEAFKASLISPRSITEHELGLIHGKAQAYSEFVNMRNAIDQALKVEDFNENVETDNV